MAIDQSNLRGDLGVSISSDGGADLGPAVTSVGDVNGDGFGDFVVGGPSISFYYQNGLGDAYAGSGGAYLIFGQAGGLNDIIVEQLGSGEGAGFSSLEPGSQSYNYDNITAAGIGDINGDGFDDFILTDRTAYSNYVDGVGTYSGAVAHVIFGDDQAFPTITDLSQLDGSNGFSVSGAVTFGYGTYGDFLSGVGDINGDDFDDFLVETSSGVGVVFGSATPNFSDVDDIVFDGVQGFELVGASVDEAGRLGDFNGDEVDDFILRGNDTGYIVFGNAAGFGASLDLGNLNGAGFQVTPGGEFPDGGVEAFAGADVNNDGFVDAILGAPERGVGNQYSDGEPGAVYVLFGGSGPFDDIDLNQIVEMGGLEITAPDLGSATGISVFAAGDVNDDGVQDFGFQVEEISPNQNGDDDDDIGAVFIVFGSTTLGGSMSADDLGFDEAIQINIGDEEEDSVAVGVGDVNGDGVDDILFGPSEDLQGAENPAILFGSNQFGGSNDAPVAQNDDLTLRSSTIVDLTSDNGFGVDLDPDLQDLAIATIDGQSVSVGDFFTLENGVRIVALGGTLVKIEAPTLLLGENAVADFTYTVTDGELTSAQATVSIDLTQTERLGNTLDGVRGFQLTSDANDTGRVVANLGDINGDGIDDLGVSAPGANIGDQNYGYAYNAGAVFVLFGDGGGFGDLVNLDALGAGAGLKITSNTGDLSLGVDLSAAGDVNGDGVADFIIGTRYSSYDPLTDANGNPQTRSFVVFGDNLGLPAELSIDDIDGANGFEIIGLGLNGRYGDASVANAGDINGDGFDDLIIADSQVSVERTRGDSYSGYYSGFYTAGAATVIFGSATPDAVVQADAVDGSNGFTIQTAFDYQDFAIDVAAIGDINGDGIDDFAVVAGAYQINNRNGYYDNSGLGVFVVFGKADPTANPADPNAEAFDALLDVADLDGSNGFLLSRFGGNGAYDVSIAALGDFNGDGIDDFIVSDSGDYSDGYDQQGYAAGGRGFVIFGSNATFDPVIDLGQLDGSNGFIIAPGDETDRSIGASVAGGDLNNDGAGDIIISSRNSDNGLIDTSGQTFVIYGTNTPIGAALTLDQLNGDNGFFTSGTRDGSGFGVSVAAIDIDDDGRDDLVTSAPYDNQVSVLISGDFDNSLPFIGTGEYTFGAERISAAFFTGAEGRLTFDADAISPFDGETTSFNVGAGYGDDGAVVLRGGAETLRITTVAPDGALYGNANIAVGTNGGVGDLQILNGAELISRNVGYYDADAGFLRGGYYNINIGNRGIGSVTVDGAGSFLAAYGDAPRLTVGRGQDFGQNGQGELTISNGGKVGVLDIQIGRQNGEGVVTVTGEGSELVSNSDYGLFSSFEGDNFVGDAARTAIGRQGGDGRLYVLNGGDFLHENVDGLTDGPAVDLGRDAGSYGRLDIIGAGSTATLRQNGPSGDDDDETATFAIGRGGDGVVNVGDGGVLNVLGDGASLEMGDAFNTDSSEGDSTLNISGGGVVNVDAGGYSGGFVTVARDIGATASVTVTGAGSALNISGLDGAVADEYSPYGASLVVGRGGDARLDVLNGGVVSIDGGGGRFPALLIGRGENYGDSSGQGYALVSGVGSEITVQGDNQSSPNGADGFISVGREDGSTGRLVIADGGAVRNLGVYGATEVGGKAGSNGEVTVTGGGSILEAATIFAISSAGPDNAYDLYDGGVGVVNILDGGVITADQTLLGELGELNIRGGELQSGLETAGIFNVGGAGDVGVARIVGDVNQLGGFIRFEAFGFADGLFDRLEIVGDAMIDGADINIDLSALGAVTAGETIALLAVDGVLTLDESLIDLTSLNAPAGASFSLQRQLLDGIDTVSLVADAPAGNTVGVAGVEQALIEGDPGDATVYTFTIVRAGALDQTLTLDFAVTGDGATPANGDDFDGGVLPSGQVTFAAGESAAIVEIALAEDLLGETDEGFALTLSNPVSNAVYDIITATQSATIVNDDDPDVVEFLSTFAGASESDANGVTFVLGREGGLAAEVTVNYVITADGAGPLTAEAGDLQTGQLTGQVTFAVGQSEADITVLIEDDGAAEIDEDFQITITGASGAPEATIIGDAFTAFGRIYNDDGPVPAPYSGTSNYGVSRDSIFAADGGYIRTYDPNTYQYNYDLSGTLTIAPTDAPFEYLTRRLEAGTNDPNANGVITLSGADQSLSILVSDLGEPDDFSVVRVGTGGATGELNILAGAKLSTNIDQDDVSGNTGGYYSVNIGRGGGTGVVNVDGAGSFLSDNGFAPRITVGRNYGSDGELNITNGGGVGTAIINLARQDGVGRITVDGAGSTLNVNQSYGGYGTYNGADFSGQATGVTIGRQSGDGRLYVSNGGAVTVENIDGQTDNPFVTLGRQSGYGLIEVDGAGSQFNVVQNGPFGDDDNYGAYLGIGRSGQGVVRVSDGGGVNVLGDDAFLAVGRARDGYYAGNQSRLEVTSGGEVTVDSGIYRNGSIQIGRDANSNGYVLVSGADSQLTLNTDMANGEYAEGYGAFFVVGREGRGELRVENGGRVAIDGGADRFPSFQIARGDEGDYDSPVGVVTVTGVGSEVVLSGTNADGLGYSGFMTIARRAGGDGSLVIQNGGAVRNTGEDAVSIIAGEVGASATIEVSGAGSLLDAGDRLAVSGGFNIEEDTFDPTTGGQTTFTIGDGATVIAASALLGDTATLNFEGGALEAIVDSSANVNVGGEDAVGSALITGDLTQAGGEIEFEFLGFGPEQADLLTVDGDAAIDPTAIALDLDALSTASVGDEALFLRVSGTLTLDVSQIAFTLPAAIDGFDIEVVRETVGEFEEVSLFVAAVSTETVGFVGFGDTVVEGNPGDDQRFVFNVERSDDTDALTVDFAVIADGAAASDFDNGVLPTGQVFFAAGETAATVEIAIAEDVIVELDEAFTVQLSNPVSDTAYVITTPTVEGVIENDDVPGVVSIVQSASAEEGDSDGASTVDFTVTRDGNLIGELEVGFVVQATGGGQFSANQFDLTDGGLSSGVVTFADGEDTATISVSIAGDAAIESDETFSVTLTSLGGDPLAHVFGNQVATGTIENDDGTLPVLPVGREADIFGDPHLVTLDGLGYDFQAAGEFTLVEAVSGADLDVQVRTEPVPGSDLVSVITAMATDMGQGSSIMIDAFGSPALLVDGVATDVTPTGADPIDVGDGQVFFDGETYIIVFGSGEALSIKVFDGFMNVCVFLDPARDNDSVRGLLGNANGDITDDFALRDGSPIPEDALTITDGVPALDFDFLYGAFADSWRITDQTSMFVYSDEPGDTGTADYTNTDFPVAVLDVDALPQDLLDAAEAAIDALGIEDPILRESAILDFALTGDENFAAGAAGVAADPTAETTPEDAPDLPDTVGVIAETPSISEGDEGSQTITFTFYRIGDAVGALDVDFAVEGDLSANDFALEQALTGVASFGDGDETASVSFDIAGDLTPEDDEQLIIRITDVSDPDALIGAPTAITTVLNDDNAPIAFADAGGEALTTPERTPLQIDQATLLANDVDADNDDLTIVDVDTMSASSATVSIVDGVITYDPGDIFGDLAAGTEVTDTFTYTIADGTGGFDSATATITVVGVNDGPLITPPAAFEPTESDAAFQVSLEPLVNDAEQDPISFTLTEFAYFDDGEVTIEAADLVAVGALSLDTATNVLTVDPNALADFIGLDAGEVLDGGVRIEANDANATGERGTQTFAIGIFETGVEDAPIAADQTLSTDEDAALPGQLLATDADNETLVFDLSDGGAASNGSVTINADGSFVYTPDDDFNGEDEFTFTVSDGESDPIAATVTINVNPVNDAPVPAAEENSVDEDGSVSGQLTANDIDSASLTFALAEAGGPSNGTVTINADGSYDYAPDPDFNGADEFTFTVSDGEADPVAQTATITVNAVNDAPVPVSEAVFTDEDATLIGQLRATDVEGDDLTFEIAESGAPSNGSLTLNANGSFTYTPDADFNGEDSFSYTVTDGLGDPVAATITINVNPVNDAPIAEDASATGAEDTALGGQLEAADIDGDTLTFSVAANGAPSNGSATIDANGAFTYTPDANFNGDDAFTYQVSDGKGGIDTATATLTVTAVNDAPVAEDATVIVAEDATRNGQLQAADVDGDDLTYSVAEDGAPSNGSVTIDANGAFTYTPDANFNGDDAFTYQVSDGKGGVDMATATVTVTAVNDEPVFGDATINGAEDTTIDQALAASDIDGDEITFRIAPDGAPSNGSATITASQRLIYTPAANFFGLDAVTVIASDGEGGEATATLTLDIASVNDAPVAEDQSFEVTKGESFTGQAVAEDVDGDALTFSLAPDQAPSNGVVTIADDGSFTYTASDGPGASDTFSFLVDDGQGGSATGSVSVALEDGAPPTTGTGGPDEFEGGGGADVFAGGGGADSLSGGGGNDSLSGGGGGDELAGGGGKDLLQGNGGKDLLQGNGGKDTLEGGGGKDTLEGGGGKDVLIGGGGKDILLGGGGKDLLQGGGGKDTLDGGGGKDTMEGGNGRDDIIGGRGSDILTGDGGNDRFIFDRGNGRDTITDFQQNRDKIVVEGGADDFDALTITQVGDDVLIRIANTRVTIEDDDVANFTESDFIFS